MEIQHVCLLTSALQMSHLPLYTKSRESIERRLDENGHRFFIVIASIVATIESFKELKYHLTAITRQDNMGYNEKKNREAR